MIGVVVPGIALLFFLSISTAIGDSLDVGGAIGTNDILVPGDHEGGAGADPDAHFTFMTGVPSSGAVTTVTYFIDNHGGADNLSAGQILNLQAAAGIWNATAKSNG